MTRPLDPPPPPLDFPLQRVLEPAYPTPDPYLCPTVPSSPGMVLARGRIPPPARHGDGGTPRAPGFELFDFRLPEVNKGQVTGAIRATEWLCDCPAQRDVHFLAARCARRSSSPTKPRRPGNPSSHPARDSRRELLTVLFTDLVGSTQRAEALGDEAWRELPPQHDAVVQKQVETFRGNVVKSTGDGYLATFDAARAIQCAAPSAMVSNGSASRCRAGLHTGDARSWAATSRHRRPCRRSPPGGRRPRRAARLATVPDLVAGSGLQFLDRGVHELKGIDGKRQVFAVVG